MPLTITTPCSPPTARSATTTTSHSGLWGDVILVNGRPWPVMKVKRRIYRFRILNASIARSLRLRLATESRCVMVATDGGLMPAPQPVVEYRHGGAERYEVLIDFSRYQPGTTVDLKNLQQQEQRRLRPHQQDDAVPGRRRAALPLDAGQPDDQPMPSTLVPHEVMAT